MESSITGEPNVELCGQCQELLSKVSHKCDSVEYRFLCYLKNVLLLNK